MQTAIIPRKTPSEIAFVVASMLERHLKNPAAPSFVAIPLPDRMVVSVNPNNVRSASHLLSEKFIHDLSTSLRGCRVLKSNTYGIFYQIAYEPTIKQYRLESRKLDLDEQPSPYHIPVGLTTDGPLWISIREADSILLAGTRGFGKTTLLHAWTRALIHGGETEVWLYDGKEGLHFARYGGQPGVVLAEPLDAHLPRLEDELARRKDLFKQHQVYNLDSYNALGFVEPLKPIVLIVDEFTDVAPDTVNRLALLTRRERERGLHVVFASQRTSVNEVPANVKANVGTRICLPVPARQDSEVVLGRTGAEKLPKIKGRLLLVWRARLIEAQAYKLDIDEGQGGGPVENLPVGSDWQLAVRIAKESGGAVSIPMLKSMGLSPYRAEALLKKWQEAGWVVGGGQGAARRLSPGVLRAISESLKVPESPESGPEGSESWSESSESLSESPESSVSTETEGDRP